MKNSARHKPATGPRKYGFWGSLIGFGIGLAAGQGAGFWFIFTFALAVGLSCFLGRLFGPAQPEAVSH